MLFPRTTRYFLLREIVYKIHVIRDLKENRLLIRDWEPPYHPEDLAQIFLPIKLG